MTYRIDLRETLAAMNSERQKLERLYHNSAHYYRDALEWAAEHPVELSAEVLEAVVELYKQSSAFRTVIDDAEAGEVSW